MSCSRPIALFAILLALTFAVSTVCFASPMASVSQSSSEMPDGGCHGHHGPMPSPAHRCCFAAHQVPATTPIAPSPVALDAIASDVECSAFIGEPDVEGFVPAVSIDSSPPLTIVLRI